MSISKDQILSQLRKVLDPDQQRDMVSLNRIANVAHCDGHVRLTIRLDSLGSPSKEKIRADAEAAVRQLGDEIKRVDIEFTAGIAQAGRPAQPGPPGQPGAAQSSQTANPLPGVGHIIAVGAGKGGVGKSTIAVNLAVGLARGGAASGLMDGDIYGPSLPTMLGLDELTAKAEGNVLLPFEVHGIKTMSIGALVEAEKPLIWRGPMAHGAFRQIATQTAWGELDFLIIDLPPGTGDVPLTMSQLLPLAGAVVVCTPQKVAQDDARRAIRMFQQLGIEVLGVVENMGYFVGDDGKEYDIFGRGGAEMMAQTMGVPFLGTVPINMQLRANCDAGDPTANFTADDQLTGSLQAMVKALAAQVRVVVMSGSLDQPTMNVT